MNSLYNVVIKRKPFNFNKDDEPIVFATYIPIETVNLLISQCRDESCIITIIKNPDCITLDDNKLKQLINKENID